MVASRTVPRRCSAANTATPSAPATTASPSRVNVCARTGGSRGNRGMAEGPEPALAIVDHLVHEPALKAYHLLPSVRGDLLHKLGRYEEARVAFEAAAALAGNRREHDLLRRRAAEAAEDAVTLS
jgi:hypothetical protein